MQKRMTKQKQEDEGQEVAVSPTPSRFLLEDISVLFRGHSQDPDMPQEEGISLI